MAKVKMVCSHCGSEDVRADAYVYWHNETQEWEICSVFDKGAVCESEECDGGETTIIEEPIEE